MLFSPRHVLHDQAAFQTGAAAAFPELRKCNGLAVQLVAKGGVIQEPGQGGGVGGAPRTAPGVLPAAGYTHLAALDRITGIDQGTRLAVTAGHGGGVVIEAGHTGRHRIGEGADKAEHRGITGSRGRIGGRGSG